MAKVRIKYEVDDKQLDALQKQLNEIKGQNKEVEESWDKNNKKVKESGSALGGLKSTIAGIGLAALAIEGTKAFAQLTQEINKSRKEAAQLTGLTGKALDLLTAKARATANTFDKDFNEVLRTANTVANEFDIGLTEALDSINNGFATGIDINGEYLRSLQEYSTFVKQVGLDTDQFNTILQKQVTDGVFSDKGIDAIKEAQLSLQELTQPARDALKAIGISATQVEKDITSGAKTYFEVIQEVSRATVELGNSTARGQVLADIFKGAGEDAGNFVFTLQDVNFETVQLTEEQQRYRDSTLRLLDAQEDLNTELVTFSSNFDGATRGIQTFTAQVGTTTLRVLNTIIDGFRNTTEAVEDYRNALGGLSLDQLQGELDRLNQGPGAFEVAAAALGGPAGVVTLTEKYAGQAGAVVEQINKLKAAEKERGLEEEARKQKELNVQLSIEAEEAKKAAAAQQKLKEARRSDEVRITRDDLLEQERQNQLAINELFNDEEIRQEQELNDELFKINEKRLNDLAELKKQKDLEELEAQKQKEEKLKEIIDTSVNGLFDIYQGFSDLRVAQIDQQIQANELARNRELELAEGNSEKQQEINDRFDKKQSDLRRKQAQEEKKTQIFQALINTARAVVSALPNIPLSILVGAIGAAQVGFIASQPVPQFAKGVIDLKGKGSGTSDSIPAMLSRGESVMTANETRDFMPTLEAIRQKKISADIINAIAMNGGHADPVIVNDYDKLAKAVEGKPEKNVIIDENGMTGYFQRKYDYVKLKQNKFKM